jgi:hypothetical protein
MPEAMEKSILESWEISLRCGGGDKNIPEKLKLLIEGE